MEQSRVWSSGTYSGLGRGCYEVPEPEGDILSRNKAYEDSLYAAVAVQMAVLGNRYLIKASGEGRVFMFEPLEPYINQLIIIRASDVGGAWNKLYHHLVENKYDAYDIIYHWFGADSISYTCAASIREMIDDVESVFTEESEDE